jgi:hypothetical protein
VGPCGFPVGGAGLATRLPTSPYPPPRFGGDDLPLFPRSFAAKGRLLQEPGFRQPPDSASIIFARTVISQAWLTPTQAVEQKSHLKRFEFCHRTRRMVHAEARRSRRFGLLPLSPRLRVSHSEQKSNPDCQLELCAAEMSPGYDSGGRALGNLRSRPCRPA